MRINHQNITPSIPLYPTANEWVQRTEPTTTTHPTRAAPDGTHLRRRYVLRTVSAATGGAPRPPDWAATRPSGSSKPWSTAASELTNPKAFRWIDLHLQFRQMFQYREAQRWLVVPKNISWPTFPNTRESKNCLKPPTGFAFWGINWNCCLFFSLGWVLREMEHPPSKNSFFFLLEINDLEGLVRSYMDCMSSICCVEPLRHHGVPAFACDARHGLLGGELTWRKKFRIGLWTERLTRSRIVGSNS